MNKFVSALLLASVQGTNIGILSDIHLNLAYNSAIAAGNCGQSSSTNIGDPIALYARYGCDSSQMLIEAMFTRFKEQFTNVDVILVPGDLVAHKVSALDGQDPTGSVYTQVKNNYSSVMTLLQKHFPDTIILPTIGNNDGRYHSQAIDEADKADYYTFLYDQWFNVLTGNKGLGNDIVKNDVLTAGYYAMNIPNTNITVINMNSMYCDIDDAGTSNPHAGEAKLEQSWLSYQFNLARSQGRKIITLDHVYAGSRFQGEELNKEECAKEYFKLLRDNHDIMLIEVAGHDHYADLRYHSSQNVMDLPDTTDKFDFHNMIVSPGLGSWDKQNPGVAYFEINNSNDMPQNFKIEFLDLNATIGHKDITYSDLVWNSFDLSKDWGQTNIDATGLADFRKRLEADEVYTLNYLIAKLGFNYKDTTNFNYGLNILTEIDLVTTTKHHTAEYICQMHLSLNPQEYLDCANAGQPYLFLQ